jgi:hypothetical protein
MYYYTLHFLLSSYITALEIKVHVLHDYISVLVQCSTASNQAPVPVRSEVTQLKAVSNAILVGCDVRDLNLNKRFEVLCTPLL